MEPFKLIHAPTPVRHLAGLSTPDCELWLKDDGRSHPDYGGNKLRKLEWILGDALFRDARRLVTSGAAGSHHVLATALFAARAGLPVVAVLCPQVDTPHARRTFLATLETGIEILPVRSMAAVAPATLRVLRRGDTVVPPGGSSVVGTLGYLHAADELLAQVASGELPEPDELIVAVGSGGTAAGLLAGLAAARSKTRVVGVDVATRPALARGLVLGLAKLALRRAGRRGSLRRRLEVDGEHLGEGYSHPTAEGDAATALAGAHGLNLDPTYTAKTFATVLARRAAPRRDPPRRILYWHTLSAIEPSPTGEGALPGGPLAGLLTRD